MANTSNTSLETEGDIDQFRDHLELGAYYNNIPTPYEKMISKMKENPFLPTGCVATLFALTYGLWSFKNGPSKRSQAMMRVRLVTQGLTITAICLGMVIGGNKNKS